MTFKTFAQSDEKTWPDQHKDNDKYNDKDNKDKDNDKQEDKGKEEDIKTKRIHSKSHRIEDICEIVDISDLKTSPWQ